MRVLHDWLAFHQFHVILIQINALLTENWPSQSLDMVHFGMKFGQKGEYLSNRTWVHWLPVYKIIFHVSLLFFSRNLKLQWTLLRYSPTSVCEFEESQDSVICKHSVDHLDPHFGVILPSFYVTKCVICKKLLLVASNYSVQTLRNASIPPPRCAHQFLCRSVRSPSRNQDFCGFKALI